MLRRTLIGLGLALMAGGVSAGAGAPGSALGFRFDAIDGGEFALGDFGGPVLVVNTASRCGFTGQYDGLQALWDRYRDRGLTVLGVPSQSFRQELATAEAVRDFCEVNFSIDFPMTDITPVAGREAHPFYRWAAEQGAGPMWNFHKILIDRDGRLVGAWGPTTGPDAAALRRAVEGTL